MLEIRGVLIMHITAIEDMYNGAETRVSMVGGDLNHFPVIIGLHQGSTQPIFICFGNGCSNTTYSREGALVHVIS